MSTEDSTSEAATNMGAIFDAALSVHQPAIHQIHAGTEREAPVLVGLPVYQGKLSTK